jgi:hypothetical protein
MITPVECRQRAVECRQMAERAPTLRVRSILTDMAWTWTRLALEAEQLNPKSARAPQRLVQPSSLPEPPPSGD